MSDQLKKALIQTTRDLEQSIQDIKEADDLCARAGDMLDDLHGKLLVEREIKDELLHVLLEAKYQYDINLPAVDAAISKANGTVDARDKTTREKE